MSMQCYMRCADSLAAIHPVQIHPHLMIPMVSGLDELGAHLVGACKYITSWLILVSLMMAISFTVLVIINYSVIS